MSLTNHIACLPNPSLQASMGAKFKAGGAMWRCSVPGSVGAKAETLAEDECEDISNSSDTMSQESYTWSGGNSDFFRPDTLQKADLKEKWRKSTQGWIH